MRAKTTPSVILSLFLSSTCWGASFYVDPVYGSDDSTGRSTVNLAMTGGATSGNTLVFAGIGYSVFPEDVIHMTSATAPPQAGQYRVVGEWGADAVMLELVSGDPLSDRNDWVSTVTDGPLRTFAALDAAGSAQDLRYWVMESEIAEDDGAAFGTGIVTDNVLTDTSKSWSTNSRRQSYFCVIKGKHYPVVANDATTLTLAAPPPPGSHEYYLCVRATYRYLSQRPRLAADVTRPAYAESEPTGFAIRWVSSLADGTGDGTTTSVAPGDPHMAWTFKQAITEATAKTLTRVMDDGLYLINETLTCAHSGTTGPIIITGYANQNGASTNAGRSVLYFGPLGDINQNNRSRWIFEKLLLANGRDDRTAMINTIDNSLIYNCEFSCPQGGAISGITPRIIGCWIHHPGATAITFESNSNTAGSFGAVMFCRFSEPQEKLIDSSTGPLLIMFNEFSTGSTTAVGVTNSASNGIMAFNTFNGSRAVCSGNGRFDAFNIFVNNLSGSPSYTCTGNASSMLFSNVFWNNWDLHVAGSSIRQVDSIFADPGIPFPLDGRLGAPEHLDANAHAWASPFAFFGDPMILTAGAHPFQSGDEEGDSDTDGDGIPDGTDACPGDPGKASPGVCGCGLADTDTDRDRTPDCRDQCPRDPAKTAPGACGCGVSDVDRDGDGTPDCADACPDDPDKTVPGICGCGSADTDTDQDGTPDCQDSCPGDALKTTPGRCGCGTPDTDSDADTVPDCLDNCPLAANPDQLDNDGDGMGNACDTAPDDDSGQPIPDNTGSVQRPWLALCGTGAAETMLAGLLALAMVQVRRRQ